MFEEITSASWPIEVTVRAFAATTACALTSRALLNACGTTTKARRLMYYILLWCSLVEKNVFFRDWFLVVGGPQGQQLEAFWSKTEQHHKK